MFTEVINKTRIKTVTQLAQAIWTEHYIPIIGNEQTEYMLSKFQSVEAIALQIESEDYLYFLIEHRNRSVGYLAIHPREKDLLISKIYLERTSRGLGLGKKAIAFIEKLAQELEKPVITLTVNKHNSDSIAAYSRWGFRIINTIVTDIGGGFVMDDYVMQKKLAPAK